MKDIDDVELEFEVKKHGKELQVDFIRTKKITSDIFRKLGGHGTLLDQAKLP